MKAKREEEKELQKLLKPIEEYHSLSSQAQIYEPIFLNYIKDMEQLGKNWRLVKNTNLFKNLNIPLGILLEIKRKYIFYSRKKAKSEIIKNFISN